VVFGLPETSSLMKELSPLLPLWLDDQGRVIQRASEPLAGVRDNSSLGVLQTIASPFNPERAVLVVTGTTRAGLDLAVGGLRQGGLQGNLATVMEPAEGSSFLQVRTYDITAEVTASPMVQAQEIVPTILTVLVGGAALALAGARGVAVFQARRRARSVNSTAAEETGEEFWLDELESEGPTEIHSGRLR